MLRKSVAIFGVLLGIACLALSARADELQDISNNIASTPDLVAKGHTVFMTNCMTCHGAEGKGDGPAAVAFNPKPRNFTVEKFKQGSSPSAAYFTVSNGMGSMPAFVSMSVADRMAAVHYVLSLSPNHEKDIPETLAKIGLDPAGKPLAGFKGKADDLPVEFIIERLATDGNINSINYAELIKKIADQKALDLAASTPKVITPDLKRGETLFTYCKICHGAEGQGTVLAKAPQIAGQDTDYLITQLKKFQSGVRGSNPNDVNGLRMRPMSRLLQSEEDVVHVANYIHQLKPVKAPSTLGGDPQRGQAFFGTCMTCHGADAMGVKAMNAPALAHLQDWYIAEQIHQFKAGYRGTDSRDTTGATMRGMAMTIVDDQTLKDIAAYIGSLK